MRAARIDPKTLNASPPPAVSHRHQRTPPDQRRHCPKGQSAVEYLVVCAALAAALGLALTEDGALAQLRDGFMTAYRAMTYALSLPW